MSEKQTHRELNMIKEIIQKDQHLFDRVIDRIREIRQSSGQNMEEFMRSKRAAENSQKTKRSERKKQDI